MDSNSAILQFGIVPLFFGLALSATLAEDSRTAEALAQKAKSILEDYSHWKQANPGAEKFSSIPLESIDSPVDPFAASKSPPLDREERDGFDYLHELSEVLGKIITADPVGAFERIKTTSTRGGIREDERLTEVFAEQLLRARVAQLLASKHDWPIQPLTSETSSLPDGLDATSPTLERAWLIGGYLQSVSEVDSTLLSGKEPELNFLGDNDQFYEIIYTSLVEDDWSEAEKISKFGFGNLCATGHGDFLHFQALFGAIHALEQEKETEAFARLAVQWLTCHGQYEFYFLPPPRKDFWDRLYLEHFAQLGFDWETAAVGYLIHRPAFTTSRCLSELGTEKTFDLMIEAAALGLIEENSDLFLSTLSDLVSRASMKPEISDPFAAPTSGSPIQLTRDQLDRFLQTLPGLLETSDDSFDIENVISTLSADHFEQTRPILESLARSPIPSVSRSALTTLHDHGIMLDHSPTTVDQIHLTLRMGGKPLRNHPLTVNQGLQTRDGKSARFSFKPDPVSTGPDAILDINRADFAHASDTRGILELATKYSSARNIGPVDLNPGMPVFVASRSFESLSPFEKAVIDLPIHTVTIDFQIPDSRKPDPNEAPRLTRLLISVSALGEEKQSRFPYTNPVEFLVERPVGETITLPNLGEGLYRFAAWVPGCQPWESESLLLTQDQQVKIRPVPGFRIEFSLDTPQTQFYSTSLTPLDQHAGDPDSLITYGDTYLHQDTAFDHLSPGRYRFEVWSKVYLGLDPTTHELTIDTDDPAVIDLGTVRVPVAE